MAVISSAPIRHGGWAQREIQLALDHVGTLAEPRRFLIAVVLDEEARETVGELDERLASWLEDIVWVALWRDRTRQLIGIALAVDAAARLETHCDNRGVDWAMAEVRAAQRTTRPLCLGIFAPPSAARSVFRRRAAWPSPGCAGRGRHYELGVDASFQQLPLEAAFDELADMIEPPCGGRGSPSRPRLEQRNSACRRGEVRWASRTTGWPRCWPGPMARSRRSWAGSPPQNLGRVGHRRRVEDVTSASCNIVK